MPKGSENCNACKVRMPKNRPKLFCSNCDEIKHFKCQGLSKNEALHIIELRILWTCNSCISSILPINVCRRSTNKNSSVKFKVKCTSCNGWSYTPRNVKTCHWCDGSVHLKCFKYELGCLKCCQDFIPGYSVTSYELNMDYNGRLNNHFFNPYRREHFSNLIGNVIETEEQDNSYWNEISEILVSCNYKHPKLVLPPTATELKIFSLNVQTLGNKIEHIRGKIDFYKNFDILCFCETNLILENLPEGKNSIFLQNFYEPIVQNPFRTSGKGGGLVLYVNERVCEPDNIEKFDPNPNPEDGSGEFQFIKIHNCKGFNRTKIIGNIYRTPSKNADKFINLLDGVCRKLERHSKKHIMLNGDFNIDLLKHDNCQSAQDLIDTLAKYGFLELVSRPTRITETSCTLLDHVYSNNLFNTLSCNIITVDMSDHLATLTTINVGNSDVSSMVTTKIDRLPCHNKTVFRIFNEVSSQKFKQLIEEETWEDVFVIDDDVDLQYNKFCEVYSKHYDEAYPKKKNRTRRKNERANPKPWILPWLEDACARKQDLFFESVVRPTEANIKAYKKLNKFCKKHKDIAKNKYHKKYFETHKDCSKKQWTMINSLLNRKTKKSGKTKVKDSKGNLICSDKKVAEEFNDYFSKIASTIKAQISARMVFDPGGYQEFLSDPCQNSLFIRPTNQYEVFNIINSFKNKSTLDTKIESLKIANNCQNFAEMLSKIINNSFEQGIFPDSLKLARVVPIHKEGPKTDVTNYRPISLLSCFSKVFEKIMHNRIMEFLDKNNLLCDTQYGFRPGRSCEHALLNANNHILDALSKKEVALLLLIDFSKAFDVVEHPILLHKLQHYGIRGLALNWLKSYLSDRKQFVTINGTDSSQKPIEYGVPQGSVLGPLLFIIYINDLPNISKFAHFILYADDANIIVTGDSIHEVMQKVELLCSDIVKWVDHNGLALNLKKTKYMIFSRQRIDTSSIQVFVDKTKIEEKFECRFLGVIIDNKLNWSHHIAAIRSKMSKYIGVMYKIKSRLPLQTRVQIYQSFVQSHLNYCSLIWGFAAKSHIESLFSKQKQGMRAIMPGYVNYWYDNGELPAHTKSSFKKHEILTVHGIITMNTLIFLHKVTNFPNSLPPSINSMIPSNIPRFGSSHEDSSEWAQKYNNIPYRSTIFHKGPLLAMSSDVTSITEDPSTFVSINRYKISVKRFLINKQSSGEDATWPNFLLYTIHGLRTSPRNQQ